MTRTQQIYSGLACVVGLVIGVVLIVAMRQPAQPEAVEPSGQSEQTSPQGDSEEKQTIDYSADELYRRMTAVYGVAPAYQDNGIHVTVVGHSLGETEAGRAPSACVFSRIHGYRWQTAAGELFCSRDRAGMLLPQLKVFVTSQETYPRKSETFQNWLDVVESRGPVAIVLLTGRAPSTDAFDGEPNPVRVGGRDCGAVRLIEGEWEFTFAIDLDDSLLRRLDCRRVSVDGHGRTDESVGYSRWEFVDVSVEASVDAQLVTYQPGPDIKEVSEEEWPQFVPLHASAHN